MAYRIGVDIGGTFTDFAVWDTERGETFGLKVPTIRADPVSGLMAGLAVLEAERRVTPAAIAAFAHGTTIAVNTLIERDGARLGMLVTAGFRDLLIIQRLHVPRPQYWYGNRPTPLIPRERVFEVRERLRADGSVDTALDAASLEAALAQARAQGVEGLVVCFLHAFRNQAHEQAAKQFLQQRAPDLLVCCSSEIWPRMREYERAIVSIVNAYVMPRVSGYLGKLEQALQARGVPALPYITRSNGGVMTARSARLAPAETLLSGPASGVIGALGVARAAGIADLVTLDIGGTSADVAFIEGGRPQLSQSEHVAEFPIMMPVVGVSSIGAGGGSVIWLDDAGVLRLGPESVGSQPGPACYGKGGDRPALTDAFLAGGYLNPASFAGGRVVLDAALAERALGPIADGLGTDLAGAVEGVLRVATASLYAELSNLAAQRGVDPRDYTMVAFGGAGALLACRLAEEIGINRVLVPPTPGTLCALGALSADVASDFVESLLSPVAGATGLLSAAYDRLIATAQSWLAKEAPWLEDHTVTLSADMRYVGQSYEIDVPLEPAWVRGGDEAAIAAAFHAMHRRVNGHADERLAPELVDLRLTIAGPTPKPPLAAPAAEGSRQRIAAGARSIVLGGVRSEAAVWRRAELGVGQRIAGPAIVEQDDTTTFLPPGWTAEVHASGSLLAGRA